MEAHGVSVVSRPPFSLWGRLQCHIGDGKQASSSWQENARIEEFQDFLSKATLRELGPGDCVLRVKHDEPYLLVLVEHILVLHVIIGVFFWWQMNNRSLDHYQPLSDFLAI